MFRSTSWNAKPIEISQQQTPKARAGLRSTTALSMALMLGAGAFGSAGVVAFTSGGAALASTCAANPCAANPCAANPCAASNPCAANPCAADPCAANPCAAVGGTASGCFVPGLQEASANPCATCAPCAADSCAADPCAANPCAAAACAANPCAASACEANPCAANASAVNPCAANPCAAAAPPSEVSDAELQALYECLIDSINEQAAMESDSDIVQASWSESDRSEGRAFAGWTNFAATPYISFAHGERFATNHANEIAAAQYGKFEEVDAIPAGGIIAKPTFSIDGSGQALWETLFLMEKAEAGMSPDTNDWIYTAIMPDGSLMGRTLGENSDGMYFCAACHMGASNNTDDLLFMEPEYRIRN